MTALALNMHALLIVLGLCWGAMMWLSGHSHGTTKQETYQDDLRGWLNGTRLDISDPCIECEGVGATTAMGKLEPCASCLGTGILN